MSNKRRIVLVSLLIAALGTMSWLVLRPHDPEPIYKGKPLTYWLDGLFPSNRNTPPTEFDADEAVQQIGTNAIPTLLRLLRTRDSKFKLNLIQLSQKQRLINLNWNTALFHHLQAWLGFRCLGPNGKSAVPALIEIYDHRPPGQNNEAIENIPLIFAAIGPAAADAVPQLVQDATNTDPRWWALRSRAVYALGEIHSRPELTVPALTNFLHDMDDGVREWTVNGLGAFGSGAQSSVPELINVFLFDPSSDVRAMAASALQKIDPAAATNANAIANSFKPEKF